MAEWKSRFEQKLWHITVQCRNSQHQVAATLQVTHEQKDNETLQAVLGDKLVAKLREMQWQGYGLWAQHEAIFLSTTLDDINYQRDAKGNITLQCENHACHYRAILVPPVTTQECVVCREAFTATTKPVTPLCFHMCVCTTCFAKIDKCPLCRKPLPEKKP
jgi:hypothetical protein